MRTITSINNSGITEYIVCNTASRTQIKDTAIQLSKRLLHSTEYEITRNSKIKSVEEWEVERVFGIRKGKRRFYTTFIFNNVSQYVRICAGSPKGAYNNIKAKYGIKDDITMIIYEDTSGCAQKDEVSK